VTRLARPRTTPSPGRNHANIHDLDSVSLASPRRARGAEWERALAGHSGAASGPCRPGLMSPWVLSAHTDLDAMREALDGIEWDDL
jgi:hypothetical protein